MERQDAATAMQPDKGGVQQLVWQFSQQLSTETGHKIRGLHRVKNINLIQK
jgi:hypothetical protein